jgi:hypothetical protein
MFADLVMLGGEHPYSSMVGIAVVCAAAIWHHTR